MYIFILIIGAAAGAAAAGASKLVKLTESEDVAEKDVPPAATDDDGLKKQVAELYPNYEWYSHVDEKYVVSNCAKMTPAPALLQNQPTQHHLLHHGHPVEICFLF